MTGCDLDEYVKIVLKMFDLNNGITSLIPAMIKYEFDHVKKEDVFRYDNFCSKLLTILAKRYSRNLVDGILRVSIEKCINSTQSFEIDERFVITILL